MLYWKDPNDDRLYGTEKEAPKGAIPVKVPHDHDGLLHYLNQRLQEPKPKKKLDARSVLARGDWSEKIECIDLDRLSEQDQDKAIDMIAKYNNGARFTLPMQNLVDVLFKKSHRFGDFYDYNQ